MEYRNGSRNLFRISVLPIPISCLGHRFCTSSAYGSRETWRWSSLSITSLRSLHHVFVTTEALPGGDFVAHVFKSALDRITIPRVYRYQRAGVCLTSGPVRLWLLFQPSRHSTALLGGVDGFWVSNSPFCGYAQITGCYKLCGALDIHVWGKSLVRKYKFCWEATWAASYYQGLQSISLI